jgi:tetratricopeptide (TPR) repeat protein
MLTFRSKPLHHRNIGILKGACRREPDNLYYQYNLGVEYWQLREFQKAAESFEEVWRNCPRNWPHLSALARNFTICLCELGRYNEALDILEQCSDWFPAYTDLFYLKGNIYFAKKLYEKAIQLFNHCLELGEAPEGYVSSEGVGSYRACFSAGNTFEKMGIGQEAVKAYTVALQCRPGHLPSLYGLVRILLKTRGLDDSIGYLTRYFEFADALSLQTVMDAFAEAGAAEGAVLLAQKASAIDEKMQKYLLARAFLLREREILKLALQRFHKIPTLAERFRLVNLALEKLTILPHGVYNLGGEKDVHPNNQPLYDC